LAGHTVGPELLYIIRVSPESRQAAIEVLSELMTFAAFDLPLRVLFLDQAAKMLVPEVDPEISGMVSALALYGISDLFVETESLEVMGVAISGLSLQVNSLPRGEISGFIQSHQRVFGD
jgi:sulfur relay (sulfurtransferase) DsrF/TusC family protein